MTTDSPDAHAGDEISLWEVFAVLLRRRWTIALTTLLAVAGAAAVALLPADSFTTEGSFRPQGSEASASQLMALASQFGVSVPGGEEASPEFYTELLTSREILYRLAIEEYQVEGVGTASLAELLEIREEDETSRLEETIEVLRDDVLSVRAGRGSGIVTVQARTDWPDLSVALASGLLEEVARFNLDTRQSQAAAERVFIEERVDGARDALMEAESVMQAFLQANRQWDESSELRFQHDRLDREISLRQQVYTTLVESFENARISEVRDTPVITLLQDPYFPAPDDRRLILMVVLGTVLGGAAGLVLAFAVEALQRPGVGDPAREEFRVTWDKFVGSLPFARKRPT